MECLLKMQLKMEKDNYLGRMDVLRLTVRLIDECKRKGVAMNFYHKKRIKREILCYMFYTIILYCICAVWIYFQWEGFEDYKNFFLIIVILGYFMLIEKKVFVVTAMGFGGFWEGAPVLDIWFYSNYYIVKYQGEEVKCPNGLIVETRSKFLLPGVGVIKKKNISERNLKIIQKLRGRINSESV